MPYVLLGLHRYFRSQSTDGLLGAGAALWAQNLSSGYYMLFFGPFVAMYALVEMALGRAWRQLRVWRDLGVMAAVSLAATLPFALPYLERTRGTRRALTEVIWFSADLEAWLTASPMMNVWEPSDARQGRGIPLSRRDRGRVGAARPGWSEAA